MGCIYFLTISSTFSLSIIGLVLLILFFGLGTAAAIASVLLLKSPISNMCFPRRHPRRDSGVFADSPVRKSNGHRGFRLSLPVTVHGYGPSTSSHGLGHSTLSGLPSNTTHNPNRNSPKRYGASILIIF